MLLATCGPSGITDHVTQTIGPSTQFSQEEIAEAMQCVKKEFCSFKGCELTDLWYDEEQGGRMTSSYLENGPGSVNGVARNNSLTLLSNFNTGSIVPDGNLSPNQTYSEWNWTLVHDSKTDKWRLDDYGY